MNFTGIFREIIGAVAGLYAANSIPLWHIPVILSDPYQTYLPYANAAIIGSALAKILMYLSPWYRLQLVFEAIAECIALLALYYLYIIFPFHFEAIDRIVINDVIRFGLIIVMIAVCVALLSVVYRFIRGKP